ncbi:MAG: hypothetical protein ACTHNI_00445 [Cellulosimicrobium cellulans]
MSTPSPSGHYCAFGDESASRRQMDPGVYMFAAAVLEPARVVSVRAQMRDLLLPGQKKVHWREDRDRRHSVVVDAIAQAGVEALVVVRQGPDGESDERRRRKTLERFVPELEALGCAHLVLESRGPADDRRDRVMLDALRARQLSTSLRLDHTPGPGEPLLWIADAVCGAVTADRTGDPQWLDRLRRSTEVITIEDRPRT